MREQWRLPCTSQWGWETPLSEHVYCVAVAFKMTERVEQWICTKFCIKLEHSSVETIWVTQKATAMGNWWLAASCITSHAEFFAKPQVTRWLSPTYNLDLVPCDFWLFPKLESPLKGRDFKALMRIKIWWGSWWRLGELCEVPRRLLWRGLKHHCPMHNISCFLYLLQ